VGRLPQYENEALALASIIASKSWSLVYGGGQLGLMGKIAREVVARKGPGSVHGIIPRALLQGGPVPEPQHFGSTTVVDGMHARKRLMVEEADAFVALPGGLGTLEELLEMATWNQLGIHSRPVVVFNIDGYFDGLFRFLRHAVDQGFIPETQAGIIKEATTADEVASLVGLQEHESASGSYTFLDWSTEDKEENPIQTPSFVNFSLPMQ
jgi:uncharacterized protein (TIGR00730 family)